MIKALILGALGFTGKHLVRRLRQIDNIRILGADIYSDTTDDNGLDDYVSIDIGQEEQVSKVVRDWQPDWIFNLVGMVRGEAAKIYQTNLMGNIYLLEAVRLHVPNACILLVGTSAEYGRVTADGLPIREEQACQPVGAYGASKNAATTAGMSYAKQYGMKVVIARPFNIIGAGIPPSLVLGAILQRVNKALATSANPVITVGNLDTKRDFVAVEDVVEAYLKMIQGEYWGEVFNICSGQPRSIREIIELALLHAPCPVSLEVDPSLVRSDDVAVLYGSLEKANRAFGFQPKVSLEQSIEEAWKYEVNGGGFAAI